MLKPGDEPEEESAEPWRPAFMSQAEKIAKVVAEAERLGESDTRAIVKAVEEEGPVGRFILKLLNLPASRSRRGRPLADLSDKVDFVVAEVVSELRQSGRSAAEAYQEAPVILAQRGVFQANTRGKLLSVSGVKAACRRRDDRAKHWFQPPASE